MLDLLVIGLFQAAAGDPAAPTLTDTTTVEAPATSGPEAEQQAQAEAEAEAEPEMRCWEEEVVGSRLRSRQRTVCEPVGANADNRGARERMRRNSDTSSVGASGAPGRN